MVIATKGGSKIHRFMGCTYFFTETVLRNLLFHMTANPTW